MNNLSAKNWYVAAYSKELKPNTVIKRMILGKNIALYRGDKIVSALKNSCPHKMLELSLGKVQNDELRCRYHGWSFDKHGRLTAIPCIGEDEKILKCSVKNYVVIEQDGFIWIWPSDQMPPLDSAPPSYPNQTGYYSYDLSSCLRTTADLVLENGLDCAHTGFVHTGLFRSKPNHYVEAVINTKQSGIEIQTIGEGEKKADKKSILSFLTKDTEIYHTDEYIKTHTVYVDYKSNYISATTLLICTPETKETTRTYTRMATKFNYFNKTQGLVLKQIVKKVIKQDVIPLC